MCPAAMYSRSWQAPEAAGVWGEGRGKGGTVMEGQCEGLVLAVPLLLSVGQCVTGCVVGNKSAQYEIHIK